MDEELKKSALEYHRLPRPGKVSILATKQLTNQRDLALAYSPGVAVACEEIKRNPDEAVHLTSRANLIAVITNGNRSEIEVHQTAITEIKNVGATKFEVPDEAKKKLGVALTAPAPAPVADKAPGA